MMMLSQEMFDSANLKKIFEKWEYYDLSVDTSNFEETRDNGLRIRDDAPPEAKEAYEQWRKYIREREPRFNDWMI